MASITSASGASYVKVDVDEKATIDEIASAAGISGPGINYYEVQKKEDVSAAKAMLLYVAPSAQWIDGDAARSKLGLTGAKAAVTLALVATKAGAGSKLWVQSTSSNRALPEGSSLIKAVAGGASAGAGKSVSAAAAKPTKGKAASKRKADDDDEEEEDAEEEEEEKPTKSAPAKRARKDADSDQAPAVGKKMTAKERAAEAAAAAAPAAAAGGSSSGGTFKIVGTSGSSYVLIPVTEKAPVDEVCAAAGIACNTGFYEVGGKKEDVSAQKELVLLTVPAASAAGSAVNDDYASIRKLLGMGTGKASINAATVKAKAGPHARLFVQSTSGNRGILAGTLLCVKTDYGFGGGAGAGGVGAAAAAGAGGGSGPVSLASIFAAHYSGGVATGAPANPKRTADDPEVREMEDEEDSSDKAEDHGFSSPEFRAHLKLANANAREARQRFLSDSTLGRWTSSRGHQFLVRATATDMSGDDWPLAWYGHESQPVVAAAFFLPPQGATDKSFVAPLAMVWLTSLTADESASAWLEAYAADGAELDGILDGGNYGVLETVVIGLDDDVMDGFCVTSSSDAMPALNCPALQGLSVAEVESGIMSGNWSAAAAAKPSKAAAVAPASVSGSGVASRFLRSPSGSYMLLPISSKSTVAQVVAACGVPKTDVEFGMYELGAKMEEVAAKKAMVLWGAPSGSTVVDDAASIRAQLGVVGIGPMTLSSSSVTARLGGHNKLFVQSTSTNRALQPGTMLCLKLQGQSAKGIEALSASSSSSAAAAAAPSSSSSASPAAAASLNPYMPALQFIDWARVCDLDDGFSARTIFPSDSAWFAEAAPSPSAHGHRDPAHLQAGQSLIDKLASAGFAAASDPAASSSGTTPAPLTEGWFRDGHLEDRIRRQVLREEGTMARESLRVTAHAHSGSPFPGSRCIVCIEIGLDEGADMLVATDGPQWMVLARHTDAHMILEGNQFDARLDDARRIVVRKDDLDRDEEEAKEGEGRGPPQQVTDVNSPQCLIQTLDRHFKNVVAGKIWA